MRRISFILSLIAALVLIANTTAFASQYNSPAFVYSSGPIIPSGFLITPDRIFKPNYETNFRLAQRSREECIKRRKAKGKKLSEKGINKCMQSGGNNPDKAAKKFQRKMLNKATGGLTKGSTLDKSNKTTSSKTGKNKKKKISKTGKTKKGRERNLHRFVKKRDRDGDSRISPAEWDKNQNIFKKIDQNRDGFLIASEIAAHWANRAIRNNTEIITSDSDANADSQQTGDFRQSKTLSSERGQGKRRTGNKKNRRQRRFERESVELENQDTEDTADLDLEESKSVSAGLLEFSSENAPKTIADIAAILDQQKPDPEKVEKRKRVADLTPPETENKKKLVKFYLKRGTTAGRIGRTLQQLEDFKTAERFSREAKSFKLRVEALKRLAGAQYLAGEWRKSIKNREKIVRVLERKQIGRSVVGWKAILVSDYARIGNFDASENYMQQIELRLENFPRKEKWQRDKSKIQAKAARAKANLLDSQRKYQDAEKLYKSSLSFLQKSTQGQKFQILRDSIKSEFAYNLMRQQRWIEAEIQAREALFNSLSRAGKYSTETTTNLLLLADVIGGQGRFKEAIVLSEAAVEILKSLGLSDDALPLNRAQKILAVAYFNSGDIRKSLETFDEIEAAIASKERRYNAILVRDITWHLAMLLGERHEKALPLLKQAMELRKKGRKGGVAFLRAALATALWRNGKLNGALKHFEKAIPHVLAISSSEDEEFTQGTLIERRKSVVLSFYLAFLADIEGTTFSQKNDVDARARSFEIADIIRGQSVQRALSASSARRSVRDPELSKVLRAEQDIRKLLSARNALLSSLLSQPEDQRDKEAIKQLRQDINKSRAARQTLQKELNRKFPDFAELLNPKAPTIKDVQKGLKPNESLISIYVGREKTYIWAVPKEGTFQFTVAEVGQDRLRKTVEALREALDPRAETLGDIPDFDLRLAFRLYKQILEPVEAGWKNSNSLLITTNGALGELPFAILPTKRVRKSKSDGPLFANYRDVPWLARTHAITIIPSAASLLTLRSLPPSKSGRSPFIGFGDPFFNSQQSERHKVADIGSPRDISSRGLNVRGLPVALRAAPSAKKSSEVNLSDLPRLSDTADEVRQLAIAMDANLTNSVFLGKQANEEFIKSKNLSGFRVLAFATHGLIPGELSGLNEPALAFSSPEVAGTKGDGLLTMSEILGLKLDADWVILSACNTGSSRGNGAEAVSGLGRAFFYAGTRSLLVSSWPVETISARLLTTDIFERQKTDKSVHRSEALRQAMVALIDGPGHVDKSSGNALYSYAHPIFWAPFILVGDGA